MKEVEISYLAVSRW